MKDSDEIQLDELKMAPVEDGNAGVPDEIMKVNLKKKLHLQITFISRVLQYEKRDQLVTLL